MLGGILQQHSYCHMWQSRLQNPCAQDVNSKYWRSRWIGERKQLGDMEL